jgi:hypothetical protein
MPHRSRVTLLAWCLGASVLTAQSDRISIRLVPKPASTVHYRLAQEVAIDVSPDASVAAGLPIPAIGVLMKMDVAWTQVTGNRDEQGRLESQMTYDQMDISVTLNGQPMPGAAAANQMVGRQVMLTYDEQGNIADVKMPSDFPAQMVPMKQLIMGLANVLPPVTLGIGETTTVPLDLMLPLPMPGGGASPAMKGQSVLKLLSVDPENAGDSAGRIAHFESTTDVSLNSADSTSASTGPLPGVKMDLRLNAKGTLDADLDGGFIRTNQSEGTFDGVVSPQGAGASVPAMKLAGTLKITMSGSY